MTLGVFSGLPSPRIGSGHASSSAVCVLGLGGVPLVPGAHLPLDLRFHSDVRLACGCPGWAWWPFPVFSLNKRPPAVRSLLKSRHREHSSCSFCFPTPAGREFCLVKKNLEEMIAEPLHNEGMDFLKPEIEAFLSFLKGQNL